MCGAANALVDNSICGYFQEGDGILTESVAAAS